MCGIASCKQNAVLVLVGKAFHKIRLHRVFAMVENVPNLVMGKDHPLLTALRNGGLDEAKVESARKEITKIFDSTFKLEREDCNAFLQVANTNLLLLSQLGVMRETNPGLVALSEDEQRKLEEGG